MWRRALGWLISADPIDFNRDQLESAGSSCGQPFQEMALIWLKIGCLGPQLARCSRAEKKLLQNCVFFDAKCASKITFFSKKNP